jgi:hypothetical protein
VSVDAGSKVQE